MGLVVCTVTDPKKNMARFKILDWLFNTFSGWLFFHVIIIGSIGALFGYLVAIGMSK